MNRGANLPPNRQVGHGLMKQKSRRLLDSVLRRRMLVDSMKGYGDELQYNFARGSPNYDRKELSSAIQGLKAMQEKLMKLKAPPPDGLVVFQSRGGFSAPIPPTRTSSSPDRNANYITGSRTKPPIFMFAKSSPPQTKQSARSAISNLLLQSMKFPPDLPSETLKPPIFAPASPPTMPVNSQPAPPTKDTARSAISNALFQSMNFKQFQQKTDPPRMSKWDAPDARRVPINVQNKENNRRRATEIMKNAEYTPEKCTSSAFVTMAKPSVSRSENGKIASTTTSNHAPWRRQRKPAEPRREKHQRNGMRPSRNDKNDFVSTQSVTNGGPASKFRVKKISIAAPPEPEVTDDRPGRNYVAGVKLYKTSPEAHITINLKFPELSSQNAGNLEYQNSETGNLKNDALSTTAAEKPFITDIKSSDFIKGMTFSAKQEQPVTKKSSFDLQNAPRVNAYEDRHRNKTSSPHVGAARKAPTVTSNGTTRDLNEAEKEQKIQTEPKTQKKQKKNDIPQFYFPKGKPRPKDEVEVAIQKISDVCACFENRTVPAEQMGLIAKACNLSHYWKGLLLHAATEDPKATEASGTALIKMWTRVGTHNHDASSRFVALLAKPGKNCLDFEDFLPLLKDIVDSHPGLIFLKDAPEFHTRYMNTVIARIFYVINRSWSGQITASELRKSNFLTVLSLLEEEDDINAITDYFSYEHFYVIYCKFWELDTDHDLVIDRHDLMAYGDGVLSSRLIDRVLSGAVTRWDTSDHQLGRMSYVDFVWFIISEEDKKTPTSIEYWYRCMDLDGDGYISMYEMEYFYEEQSQKLEQLDIEPLPFEDCVCQIFDIVNPKHTGKVSLNDLKKCKMAHVFFDTFFNVAKYLNNEQKDPLTQNALNGTLMVTSDWDNFAAEEYEMLVAEEQSSKLTDLSKALLDDDGDRIDILEDEFDQNLPLSMQLNPGKRDDDMATEFAGLNFMETTNAEPRMPLAQT